MTDENTIDISGLDKAEVLLALYNASKPQGMGFLMFDPKPMTLEEAQQCINVGRNAGGDYPDVLIPGMEHLYFDYLKGRVLKVSLKGDSISTWGYDRDNGEGAAKRALAPLLAKVAVQ